MTADNRLHVAGIGWVRGDAPSWAVGLARRLNIREWAIACFGRAPAPPHDCLRDHAKPVRLPPVPQVQDVAR